MNVVPTQTGHVASGDVVLFYRRFGTPGATPILIFHGAGYYDSADWIDVGSELARNREVVAFDTRGYGESTWSPSKNYSVDASIGDVIALIDHLGWKQTVFMGHSRGGAFALLMASRFPERAAGLIMISRPLHLNPLAAVPAGSAPSVGHKAKIYPTREAALADMSRDTRVSEGSPARAQLDRIPGAGRGRLHTGQARSGL